MAKKPVLRIRQGAVRAVVIGLSAATLAAGTLGAGSTARAQEAGSPDRSSELVERLFSCRELADDAERLACFDREVAVVSRAAEENEIVITDRKQIEEARKGLFGFSLGSIGLFDDEDEVERIERIEATIADATVTSQDKLYFLLDNGAKWIQTDSVQVLGRPGKGDTVVIEQAAMGSYMASINGRRSFRVKRVN